MSSRHPMFMALSAVTFASWGKVADAKSVYGELLARSAREYVSPNLLAVTATTTEEQEEGIRFAQRAYEIHDPQLRVFSKYWPGTQRLQETHVFGKILTAMR